MQGTARFIANSFPLFLLEGVFGSLMDDIGSAFSIARGITERLGTARAIMAVVLACAALTYGGVSLFVVAFAVFPVADALFRQAEVPHRLIPAATALGASAASSDSDATVTAKENSYQSADEALFNAY